MSLTDLQKMNIRRHLRYPVLGLPRVSPGGLGFAAGSAGYRFFEAFGQLEFRLSNLNVVEEASLVGLFYSSVIIIGIPVTGDVINFTVTKTGMTSQVLTYTVLSTDNPVTITQALANLVNNNVTLTVNGFFAISPLGIGPFAQYNPVLVNPNIANSGVMLGVPGVQIGNVTQFLTTAVGSVNQAGSTLSVINPSNGVPVPPTSTVDGSTNPPTVISGYTPIADYLEGQVPGAGQNLDTIRADVWYARRTEVNQRRELYDHWCARIANFMGVAINEAALETGLFSPSSGSSASAVI